MEGNYRRSQFILNWSDPRGKQFQLFLGQKTLIMGALNITPDSFYDGGRFLETGRAVERALAMEEEGADIIDLGGESSRPGARSVSVAEELKRVLPVLEQLSGKVAVPISIDTYKAEVARKALQAGAQIVNDISALRFDPDLPEVLVSYSGPYIMMHMQGTPEDMQRRPVYQDVLREIKEFFQERMRMAKVCGVDPERIILDPGIGFGKKVEHNLKIIAGLRTLTELSQPLLIGPSRKSFIGAILEQPVEERLWGTAGAVAAGIAGGAHIIRVHDVREMREVATVMDRIIAEREEEACSEC